jgi:hypothetical protein
VIQLYVFDKDRKGLHHLHEYNDQFNMVPKFGVS